MALVRSGNKSKIFEADTKFNSVFDTEYKPGGGRFRLRAK